MAHIIGSFSSNIPRLRIRWRKGVRQIIQINQLTYFFQLSKVEPWRKFIFRHLKQRDNIIKITQKLMLPLCHECSKNHIH